MLQPTKITLRDNNRNILQLNRKNILDDLVSIINELYKPVQTKKIYSNFNIDFSIYNKYDLQIFTSINLICIGLNKFCLVRIQNTNGYTISFNDR